MPRTDFDEVYENGQLVSRVPRIVTDAEIEIEQATTKLRQAIAQIDAALADPTWTTAEAQQHLRLALRVERAFIRKLLRE